MASAINTDPDGTTSVTWGPHGKGIAMFDSRGHFAIINVDPDIPKVAANTRLKGTAAENTAIATHSISYFGTYTVTGTTVTLRMEASSYPNFNGTDQLRNIVHLNKDELRWIVPAAATGGRVDTARQTPGSGPRFWTPNKHLGILDRIQHDDQGPGSHCPPGTDARGVGS